MNDTKDLSDFIRPEHTEMSSVFLKKIIGIIHQNNGKVMSYGVSDGDYRSGEKLEMVIGGQELTISLSQRKF